MQRRNFINRILGGATLLAFNGASPELQAFPAMPNQQPPTPERSSFGAVHLRNTSIEKSIRFWTNIVGLVVRSKTDTVAEFGTDHKTLVVVHQTATLPFQKGYSGLYHVAIHAPNEHEFARMVYRATSQGYPCSPTDHTMSKSLYLTDPDGITIEFTLETPERFKRVVTSGGLKMEDAAGNLRSASAMLDLGSVLRFLPDKDLSKGISNEAYVGHYHLYATNVAQSNSFYRALGFEQFNNLPQFKYADVGAGGPYKHRIAMNAWHGSNRPLAPKQSAGLEYFEIDYTHDAGLARAMQNLSGYTTDERGCWVTDPTGNSILLATA